MKIKQIFAIIVGGMILSACQPSPTTSQPDLTSNQASAPGSQRTISVSVPPLAFLLENIVGSEFEVLQLAANQDAHHIQLGPKDVQGLLESEIFFFLDANFEGLAASLTKSKDLHSIELNQALRAEIGQFTDPHSHLSPRNMMFFTEQILEQIILLDPQKTNFYQSQAAQLQHKLSELDQDFAAGLQNCLRKEVLLSHDFLGHLASDYNFTSLAVLGSNPKDHVSAKSLSGLISLAKEQNLNTILVEEGEHREHAHTLVQAAGLKALPVYSLEQSFNKSYFQLMQSNLNSLKQALECQS